MIHLSYSSSLDSTISGVEWFAEAETQNDSSCPTIVVPTIHSYDVHVGTGTQNSSEVMKRFLNDLQRLRTESQKEDSYLSCEIKANSRFYNRIEAYLAKHMATVSGVQHDNNYDVLSVLLSKTFLVSLLERNFVLALENLAMFGMEELRILDEGITVLFHPTTFSPSSKKRLSTKSPSLTLLDTTLDILARSASSCTTSGQSTVARSPGRKKARYHWHDKLTRRVAALLGSVFSPETLASSLDVDLDTLPCAVPNDPIDLVFLVIEEWRSGEESADVCPRLLDLLTDHVAEQNQLEEMINVWQRDAEFLPSLVSDNMLTEVARQISNCWQSVAYELNLGRNEIQQIVPVEDDKSGTEDEDVGVQYARRMLLHWKQTSGRYATRTVLAHALQQCDLPNALEIADQINSLPGRTDLKKLMEDLIKSRPEMIDERGETVAQSASEHRRRRLAKKRITSPSGQKPSASDQDSSDTGQPHSSASTATNNVTSPWEATCSAPSTPYFGVHLEKLPARSDKSLVPLFIDKCIAFIEETGMTARGIYRISGISSAVSELENLYTKDHNLNLFKLYEERPDRYDENCVASALKSYLRKLPEPVIPSSISQRLAEVTTLDQDTQSMVDRLKLIVVFGMSEHRRALLQEIACHLKRVAEHATENLMKASNLAVVFWPTLMQPDLGAGDMVLLRDLPRLLQNVTMLLIEHAEEIFIENQPW